MNESIAAALKWKRSELMSLQLEDAALRLFEQRGFGNVTVDEIAEAAGISVRTFYRYFPAKELLLHVRIEQRSAALTAALASRPDGEPPLTSLRVAIPEAMGTEDPEVVRRWITVLTNAPELVRGVLGGVQMKIQGVIAGFLAGRLGPHDDAFTATILAGAVSGAVQAALTTWFVKGGDLRATVSKSLAVLERLGDPAAFGTLPPAPS
jgi:TetR/AcrR family transcriptional regulator, regulator of mycofactocin system